MAAKTLATVTNTNGNVWHVSATSGQHLIAVTGAEDAIFGPVKASLVADHGYRDDGEFVRRGPGRYSYVVEE
ncbi:hypothetical protein ACT17_06430 [Mycolicibacterium conceptionense]|uniref:Uncharacterized protein n=1 Tax=Mycolicibacterium conceptionense TaxID=451644 RepID=A0A0J8UDU7_9MYCO|nr:hypothetical protein [Mycolicibacterium conceptionense]KMV19668.1 hypothetical protein ACT17_06430 [Mycolicibacterium conceptionense]